MKAVVLMVLLSTCHLIFSQSQPEKEKAAVHVTTGIFFPSDINHKKIYSSGSEFILGTDVIIPVKHSNKIYLTVGVLHSSSKGFISGHTDSTTALNATFIKIGIFNKIPLNKVTSLRFQSNLIYGIIKNELSNGEKVRIEKPGLSIFAGLERAIIEKTLYYFVDIGYQYLRSNEKISSGQWGGTTILCGISLFLH